MLRKCLMYESFTVEPRQNSTLMGDRLRPLVIRQNAKPLHFRNLMCDSCFASSPDTMSGKVSLVTMQC